MNHSLNEHTLKAFDGDLITLRGLIAEIGGRAEKAVEGAMAALANNDHDLARQVIEGDKRIDALKRHAGGRVQAPRRRRSAGSNATGPWGTADAAMPQAAMGFGRRRAAPR